MRRQRVAVVISASERVRQLVEQALLEHADEWAETIGTTAIAQFRDDVSEALHACSRTHFADSYRSHARASDLRRDFLALAREADAVAKRLHRVVNILQRLPPMQHDPAFRIRPPLAIADDLDGLAKAARRQADACKSLDRGGPASMRAFTELVKGLLRTYRNATGESGVGRSAREGRLFDLVASVLPVARRIAHAATGKRLRAPQRDEIGEFVHRVSRKK
jgi:hypothetical protein